MFYLSSSPLENFNLKQNFKSNQAGAFVSFEGLVRDHNDGQKVVALEYEAFEPLCQIEAERIFIEAREQFNVIEVKCFHRIGKLTVGEMAVWVGVIASHRDDAFNACRYIIDQVKQRLPIWKKEYYQNGDSGWVNQIPSPSLILPAGGRKT